ncbi:MAG: ATP-binding cassette domain-containing protein [Candidatus Eremiobacteraeota bacterium]|nr:ATP-binding cassette domain-containing protein [Candidatus Eremiobacteraeota bacterium]
MTILKTEGLSKSYGKIRALQNVSFEVPAGSVFGILGPNGSGKTTLLGTVLEILYPSAGRFEWFDQAEASLAEQRRRIGTLLETPNYYPYLTGAANLSITATIRGYGEEQVENVLERVGLKEAAAQPFSTFSLGMKQRLALGGALLGNPEVLVLDEPTNGLDPAGIADVRGLIGELSKEGKTIILASHLLDEVEKVCTHVAILKKGNLLEYGAMEQVLQEDTVIEVGAADFGALKSALEAFEPALHLIPEDGGFRVTGEVDAEGLNRHCFGKGVALSMLRTKKRDLESRFLEITDE